MLWFKNTNKVYRIYIPTTVINDPIKAGKF